MNMTVKDILIEWLKEHGCDGLCRNNDDYIEGCGCGLEDFIPCGDWEDTPEKCVPAIKVYCKPNCKCGSDPEDFCVDGKQERPFHFERKKGLKKSARVSKGKS